jgi:hypothetical protein
MRNELNETTHLVDGMTLGVESKVYEDFRRGRCIRVLNLWSTDGSGGGNVVRRETGKYRQGVPQSGVIGLVL